MTQAEPDHNGDVAVEQTEHQMRGASLHYSQSYQQHYPTPEMSNRQPYYHHQPHYAPPVQAHAPAWQHQQYFAPQPHFVPQQTPHGQQWSHSQPYPQPQMPNGQPNGYVQRPPSPPIDTQHYHQHDPRSDIEQEFAVRQKLCEPCASHRDYLGVHQWLRMRLNHALMRNGKCELCHKTYPLVDFVHRHDPVRGIYKPRAMCLGHGRWIPLCPHRAFGMEDIREARRQKDVRATDQETVLADCKQCFEGRRPPQRPALTTVCIGGEGEGEGKGKGMRRYDLTFNIPLEWIGNGDDKAKEEELERKHRALLCVHCDWPGFKSWVSQGRSRGEIKGRWVCGVPGCKRKYGWSLSAKGKPLVAVRNTILTSTRDDLADAGLQPCKVERLPRDFKALEEWRNIFWCDDSNGICANSLLPGRRLDLQVQEAYHRWPKECPHPGGWMAFAEQSQQHSLPYTGGPSGCIPEPQHVPEPQGMPEPQHAPEPQYVPEPQHEPEPQEEPPTDPQVVPENTPTGEA